MDERPDHPGTLAPINPQPPLAPPDDLSLLSVPSEYRKEGSDWFAVFNPKVQKVLDINLVHNLIHAR